MQGPSSPAARLWLVFLAGVAAIQFLSAGVPGTAEPKTNRTFQSLTTMRDAIINKSFTRYLKHERPTELTGETTRVVVFITFKAINKVDVRNMEYTVDVLLRQEWNDSRLAWSHKPEFADYRQNIVSPSLKDRIWLPDLFFRNGKSGYQHKMTTPNFLVRVRPHGEVLYSQKITMTFSCQMNLQTFPMDTQECFIDIGSYGYTVDQLKFYWRPFEPINLSKDMQISEFETPSEARSVDCTVGAVTSTGIYSCLKTYFLLERQLGSYLSTTYIPSILIVMVSWLNFWVNIEAVPARVTLGLLSLLGILTQAASVTSNLPRVAYIKAIDVWTIACLMFVIGALIEFALASTLARRNKQASWQLEIRSVVRQELARWCAACHQSQLREVKMSYSRDVGQIRFCQELERLLTQTPGSGGNAALGGATGAAGGAGSTEAKSPAGQASNTAVASASRPKQVAPSNSDVDGWSRFLFPASFGLYNCFYWFYYLTLVNHMN